MVMSILQPVMAMVVLTLAVFFWMLITRIPAMMKNRVHPQKGQDTRKLREHLPHAVNRVANNYNHLFEQPVVFYVICLSAALLQSVDSTLVICAWVYVAIRVAHSIVQGGFDIVVIRFYLFLASWAVLMVMIVKLALFVF